LPDIICNTSPIQYLHQLQLLSILPALAGRVIIPPAVIDELGEGRNRRMNLPDLTRLDWIEIRRPLSERAVPLVTNLGPGETEVLMLALELDNAVVILDASPFHFVSGVTHKQSEWLKHKGQRNQINQKDKLNQKA